MNTEVNLTYDKTDRGFPFCEFYDLYEKMYLMMISKEAEYRIAKAGKIPNFIVLSPGIVNQTQVFPNTKMLYTGSLVVALVLSVLLLLLRYFLHDTISTHKELENSLFNY